MRRRDFLNISSGMMATVALDPSEFARKKNRIDAAWYRRERRFAELPVGRVAYVERGRGPAALFVHGYEKCSAAELLALRADSNELRQTMSCRGSTGGARFVHRDHVEKGSPMRHFCSPNA
jgi:hypothetical protein